MISERTVSFIIYEKAQNKFPDEHQCSELGKQHIQAKKDHFFFKGYKTQLPVNVTSSKSPSLAFVSLHSLLEGEGVGCWGGGQVHTFGSSISGSLWTSLTSSLLKASSRASSIASLSSDAVGRCSLDVVVTVRFSKSSLSLTTTR